MQGHSLTPTAHLYLAEVIRSAGFRTPLERLRVSENCLAFGDTHVVFRYVNSDERDTLKRHKQGGGRLIYVLDDNLFAMVQDTHLPDDYRARIRERIDQGIPEILALADEVLTSSFPLAQALSAFHPRLTVVDPCWPELRPLTPHPRERHPARPLHIAWLGTRSHESDFAAARPSLTRFLTQHPKSRLSVYFGKQPPAWLSDLPGVENHPVLPWNRHLRRIRTAGFDLALYPVLDTETNRCRSMNKYFEHAYAGAASIFTPAVSFRDRLDPGHDCLVADFETLDTALSELADHESHRRQIRDRALAKATEIGTLARARQLTFWKTHLPL